MGVSRNQVAACAALLAVACQSDSDEMDLRTNPTLYGDTGYVARAAVDRSAFVSPMVDAREPIAEASGPYPTHWVGDDIWKRPPLVMIEEIFGDEIAASQVFTSIDANPTENTLIVTPYLTMMQLGEEERVHGRRALAQVSLRVVVHGPGATAEQREVLFDRTIDELAATPVQMLPPSPTSLVGVALRKAIDKMLGALDQSNVTRSQVPDDPEIAGR